MSSRKTSPFVSPEASRKRHEGTPVKNPIGDERISKESLALGIALWAESKPDSRRQQAEQEEYQNEYLKQTSTTWDNIYPVEETGAVLVDENNFFLSIEGSGFTHAADTICCRLGRECRGKTLYMTKKPCSVCLKKIIQMEIARIVVSVRQEEEETKKGVVSSEKSTFKPNKRVDDDPNLYASILLPSKTAYSELHHDKRVLVMVDNLEKGLELLTSPQEKEDYWLMGLALLAASRSEDIEVKVGAVLAEHVDDSIIVHGASYNGVKAKALENDYTQDKTVKGSYSIHAEQNALLLRPSSVTSLNQCKLYTTHSPCYQCSCMIKQQNIKETHYCKTYRGMVHLKQKAKHFENKIIEKWIEEITPKEESLSQASTSTSVPNTPGTSFVLPTTPVPNLQSATTQRSSLEEIFPDLDDEDSSNVGEKRNRDNEEATEQLLSTSSPAKKQKK